MKVCDFVSGLARDRKSANEIKILTDATFGDKSLLKTAIYNILKKIKAGETTDDLRHLNAKKTKRTRDIIAAVAADMNADRRVTCMDLATAPGGLIWHHAQHPASRAGASKEVGAIGTQASERGPKKEESEDLHGVRRRHPPPLHGDAGQHCDDRQDNGVIPHSSNQEAVETVD